MRAGNGQELMWRNHALCRGLAAELFFPAGQICTQGAAQARAAKAVCQACPVRAACLEFSLAANQEFGIWGGLTEEERRPLRRARQQRRTSTPPGPPWNVGRKGRAPR